MLAEPCPAGAGQAELSDTRDADRRRLMTALDAIHRRMGRDAAFDTGAGIHLARQVLACDLRATLFRRTW
jgi:hypothetical protein